MREIKFRAFDKEEKKMCYADRFNFMQYTGLKDNNGIEIYEGDILARDRYENEVAKSGWDFVFVVEFQDGKFLGYTYPGRNHKFSIKNAMELTGAEYVKIIGNIYENPELLRK